MKYISVILIIIALSSCKKKSAPIPFSPDDGLDHSSQIDESHLPSHIQQQYKMVWNDEFNGSSLNSAKWKYRLDGTQRTVSWLNRNNVSVNGLGQLVISSTKGDDGRYYTGMVATEGLFEQKYGYFECRMQMHKGLAVHSAFWLQSSDLGKTLNPAVDGVEIDIVEYLRTNPDDYFINLHWNGYGADHQTTGTTVNYPDIGEGYHIFGVEWTDKEYIFYVDGVEKWRTSTALSQRSEFIILSTEITGWAGPAETGTYPDKTYFDYVRVYTKK